MVNFDNWNFRDRTPFFRMDEPSPRPEDLYKRPEELFQHPKPVPTYGESSSLPSNKKRFQNNLGAYRGKKPWQVGRNETDMIVTSISLQRQY